MWPPFAPALSLMETERRRLVRVERAKAYQSNGDDRSESRGRASGFRSPRPAGSRRGPPAIFSQPMHDDAPSFDALERLGTSADIRDRAFAASTLSLRRYAEDRDRAAALYERIRETARDQHAEVRQRIREGALDKQAFLAQLRETSIETRDHLVEEILDVAYPPLEEAPLRRDAVHYCPSGLAEILVAVESANLGPDKTFVDLGSGLGKVALLVALLTGARAYGLEIDPTLVAHARSAARSLGLDNVRFIEGDTLVAPLPRADVYYMYIPVTRPEAVVRRLLPFTAERKTFVLSQPLDLKMLPWLRAGDAASSWLQVYEGPETRAQAIADCERRIEDARATVLAKNDGVVTARMTDLEREWRTLARAVPGHDLVDR
jgi:SAM-dependent methyltransferase